MGVGVSHPLQELPTMNTVICTQAMVDPCSFHKEFDRLWVEIDLDYGERFSQGEVVRTSTILDTHWGESGMMCIRTKNSFYIVEAYNYYSTLYRAEERGFPIHSTNLSPKVNYYGEDVFK